MSRDSRAFPSLSQKRRVSLIDAHDTPEPAHLTAEAYSQESGTIRGDSDCWMQCGNRGGYCSWCGEGNACCRHGFDGDPHECQRGRGLAEHLKTHKCVRLDPEAPAAAAAATAAQASAAIPVQAPVAPAAQAPVAREAAPAAAVSQTPVLATSQAALHRNEDCWYACGSHGGYCSWCGEGNACCKPGFDEDPGECKRAQEVTAGLQTHQCVALRPETMQGHHDQATTETHSAVALVSHETPGNNSAAPLPEDPLAYQNSIASFLEKELKGKHFRYVVNVGNSGDALIQHGTLLLFDKLGLDYEIVQPIDRQTGQLLVYAGAGNLVEGLDYKECSFFLELNAAKAAGNTIILLPATIRGFEDVLRGLGSNIVIFTRDKESFKHVQKTVSDSVKVFLSKDMAFYVNDLDPDMPRIRDYALANRKENVGLMLRTDKENPENTYIPPYNRDLPMGGRVQFDRKDPSANQETVKRSIVQVARNFLQQVGTYSQVWTNRLHVCIAGALVKLDAVHCMDNRYGKVKSIFDYSIADRFPNARWAGNVTNQPWINAITLDSPNGAWMCLASAPGLNTTWCMDAEPRDGYEFLYNGGDAKFCGDCSCCYRRQGLPLLSTECYEYGNGVIPRDAACAGDLACARKGHDGRDYGDCANQHCCSRVPHSTRPRFGTAGTSAEKFSALSISTVVHKKSSNTNQAGYRISPLPALKSSDATRYINIGAISMLVMRLLRWKLGGEMLERLTFFLDLMVWYIGTALYLSASQRLLETCDTAAITTVAFVQVFSGTALIPIADTAKVTRFSRHLLTILACSGCAFYFGVYFSLHGQVRTGILFTSNVRALEPFFTTCLMCLLAGESLSNSQYAAILVAVCGVVLAATEFSVAGFHAAFSGSFALSGWSNFILLCAANLVYSMRNIVFHQTAQLAKSVLPSPITLFMVSAVLSLPFAALLFFVTNFPTPVTDITSQLVGFDAELLMISSAAFVLYNVASFFILLRVTPTEHAVLLTGKRVVTVIFACVLSGQLPSLKQVFSLTITAAGVAAFENEKRKKKSQTGSESKQIIESKPEPVLDLAEQYLADLAQDEILDLPDNSDEATCEKLTHMKRILLSRVGAPIFLLLFTTVCMGIPAALALQ